MMDGMSDMGDMHGGMHSSSHTYDDGTPPRDCLPPGARERFSEAGTLPGDWGGIFAGNYTFAPGAATFWDDYATRPVGVGEAAD